MINKVENANVAIVGGGRFCDKLLRHLFSEHFEGRHPEVLGVADINDDALGITYARSKGIFTCNDYRDVCRLEGLDTIVEVTWDLDLARTIARIKPSDVDLIDHQDSRFLWDLLQLEDYNVALIHTSRGCVGSCKFCCEGVGVENRPRKRSIDHVREELRYIYDLGIRNISFSDDNFVSGKKRLASVCEMVMEEFPGLSWSCETRSDTTDLDCIRLMADAGCRSMHFGVESIFPDTHKHSFRGSLPSSK